MSTSYNIIYGNSYDYKGKQTLTTERIGTRFAMRSINNKMGFLKSDDFTHLEARLNEIKKNNTFLLILDEGQNSIDFLDFLVMIRNRCVEMTARQYDEYQKEF